MLAAAIGIGATVGAFETGAWVWLITALPATVLGLYAWVVRLRDRLAAKGEKSFFRPRNLTLSLLGTALAAAAGVAIYRLIAGSGGACGTVYSGPCQSDTALWFVVFFGGLWGSIAVAVVRDGRGVKSVPGGVPGQRERAAGEVGRRLATLSGLRRSRAISEEEHDRERQRILGDL